MRVIKTFGLVALAALATMAFVGATSASAEFSTQLCTQHGSLTCVGSAAPNVHGVLKTGRVSSVLASINILCLGVLLEATPLGLGNPQEVHSLTQSLSGCGTGSTHNNCTVTTPAGQQPLFDLLKIGLDEGVLYALRGQKRLQCPNIGLDCLYDLEGMEFTVGGNEIVAENAPMTELGGKFFCPDEGLLDAELETLGNGYVLQ